MPDRKTASRGLDRVLVLEMVRVTEAAAIAASSLIGQHGYHALGADGAPHRLG